MLNGNAIQGGIEDHPAAATSVSIAIGGGNIGISARGLEAGVSVAYRVPLNSGVSQILGSVRALVTAVEVDTGG